MEVEYLEKKESYQHSLCFRCREVHTNRGRERAFVCGLDLQDQRDGNGLSVKSATTGEKRKNEGEEKKDKQKQAW